jgi:D-threo-aldose 1-dehydrogenase
MNPYHLNEPGVSRVGLGCAAIGHTSETFADARACVDIFWERGVRYFDTAPMYGAGLSEHRLGRALAGQPRDTYVISTKVGRLVDEPGADGVGSGFHFDFSADGVKRSIEASLARLGTDRIDLLAIHDPDHHWEQAIGEAWPVLEDLRRQGVVGAIGAGMNQTAMLARFARETTMDYFIVAGRYSLLDHSALDELFPLCAERGIGAITAQMLHGGLIDGVPNPMIYYRPPSPEVQARVARIAAICHAHDIPTAAAAIQFPLASPVVLGVITGPSTGAQARQNLAWMTTPVPAAVWDELRQDGLLGANVPTPA